MKVSVLGLGYVGAVSAGCLARDGHEVIGVDPERTKVELINAGKAPIIEKDIGNIIAEQVAAGKAARNHAFDRRSPTSTIVWRACLTGPAQLRTELTFTSNSLLS